MPGTVKLREAITSRQNQMKITALFRKTKTMYKRITLQRIETKLYMIFTHQPSKKQAI
jgi:hypothetical protein